MFEDLDKITTPEAKEFIDLIKKIYTDFEAEVENSSKFDLENKYLGRKSEFILSMRNLGKIANKEERSIAGKNANNLKKHIEEKLLEKTEKTSNVVPLKDYLDPSLRFTNKKLGHMHVTSKAIMEIQSIFKRLGFYISRYPEVEWDYFAFEALNFSKDAPARDDWETFFMEGENTKNTKMGRKLLTPHTSSGQVREMMKNKPPIRLMNISRVYRRQIDVSHEINFFQFEGVVVDKDITFMDLKGTIQYFLDNFFGQTTQIRIRPYNFPFTEPSIEIDIKVPDDAKVGKNGWLEIGGAGMIHPNVLLNGGLDTKIYSGFAFGFGVERNKLSQGGINIPDLRMIYNNDIRFLKQF